MPPKRSKKASTTGKRNAASASPAPETLPVEDGPTSHPIPSTSTSPPSEFSAMRANFRQATRVLTQKLQQRRSTGVDVGPLEPDEAIPLVESVMDAVGRNSSEASMGPAVGAEGEKAAPNPEQFRWDMRRTIVERGCEEMLMDAAMQPTIDDSSEAAYAYLCDLLDTILVFSELDYADLTLPLVCIGSLLDLQTIAGCQYIFTWVEFRAPRLTKDMNPMKGKGPLLLRTLNELLRRLPKSQTSHVIFSGRILMFLSSVFPLGEKSGVNLRGSFNIAKGTDWEGKDGVKKEEGEDKNDEKKADGADAEMKEEKEEDEKVKMDVEEDAEDGEEKEVVEKEEAEFGTALAPTDFYPTFWSLQRYFINPPALFESTSHFDTLQQDLNRTLRVFADATKKEKEVSGSGSGTGKAKELQEVDLDMEHYFFPKFLTSTNLLDLEIADPQFRRQILVQVVVLFQYLLSLTPEEKAKANALPLSNAAALPIFVLQTEQEEWILKLRSKLFEELSAMEGGAAFRATVELVLRREENWTNWKLRSCVPFEIKEDLELATALSKKAQSALMSVTRKPMGFKFKMGNHTLTELWRRNMTTLDNFNPTTTDKSFETLAREWTMNQRKTDQMKKQLTSLESQPASSAGAQKIAQLKSEIESLDLIADSLSWRAWRVAGGSHFNELHKVKAGSIPLMIHALEAERAKVEAEAEARRLREEAGEPEPPEAPEPKEKERTVTPGPEERTSGSEGVEIEIEVAGVKVEGLEEQGEVVEDVKMEVEEVKPAGRTDDLKTESRLVEKVEAQVAIEALVSPKRPRSPEEDVVMEESESKKSKVVTEA